MTRTYKSVKTCRDVARTRAITAFALEARRADPVHRPVSLNISHARAHVESGWSRRTKLAVLSFTIWENSRYRWS